MHNQTTSLSGRDLSCFSGGALPSLGKRFQCWSHTFAEISLVMIGMINIEYSLF